MAVAQTFAGRYRFPGSYAFLETPASAKPALLQFDDPFTGCFDDLAAQNTCGELQGMYHDNQPAKVTGLIQDSNVNGIVRPVLFLFD